MLKRLYSLVMDSVPRFLRRQDLPEQAEGRQQLPGRGMMALYSALGLLRCLDGNPTGPDRKRRRLEDGEVVLLGGKDLLSELPEECICEILGFLTPEDTWPSLACLSKGVSRAPAVVPVLLSACPEERQLSAMLAFAETSGCPAAVSLVGPPARGEW